MATNRDQHNIIHVGVLSLSTRSVVASFISEFKKKIYDNATFNPIFIQLRAEDLDNLHYKVENEVHAVVLLHSILEGRLSVTDVPDAKYNNLLPRLKDLFGFEGVGVIAHSMPAFSDVTKPVQMEVFLNMQPATFESSGCVNICGKLAEMSEDDWTLLTRFLSLVPGQRKLHPSDGAEKLISKKKSTTQKSSFISSQSRPQQADSESPRKHMKANEPKLVIITPDGVLDSVKIIKGDMCKKFPPPIKIEIYANSDELDAEWKSAHAQALHVPDTDLVVCITRFHGKKEEM